MKVAILVLALVALTASVAYAAPGIENENADAEIEALLREIMNKGEQNTGEIESLPQDEEDEDNEAILQEFYAREQVPVEIQGWFRRAVRKVGRFVRRKVIPFARRVYGAYKCYKG